MADKEASMAADKESTYTGKDMPCMLADKEAIYTGAGDALYDIQGSQLHWEGDA